VCFNQNWNNYVPVAKEYLKKYGAHIPANERKRFQDAI
jgi:hypothetical protein